MNYTRFNNFVADYETKLDEESNSTNDERLQKSLSENANEYVKRSEIGSGLLSGAEATYHGREYIKKAKGTYDTLKKLPQTIEDKLNKFKGDVEGGVKDAKQVVSDAKQVASQAKDAVQGLPKNVSEAKSALENAVQSAKQTVQGKIQDVKDALNTGVQDAQDATQDGIARARGGVQDGVTRIQDATQDGVARVQDATQDGAATDADGDGVARAAATDADGIDWRNIDVSRYDGVQDGIQDALSGDPEDPLSGLSQDYFSSENIDNRRNADRSQDYFSSKNIEPVEPQEQEMQEIKPRTLQEPQQKLSYNEIYDGDIQPQEPKPPEPPGEIQSNYHFPPKDPKDIRKVPPNDNSPPGETANLNKEITTAGKETEEAGKKAEGVAGKLQKGAKLASKEEEIGEGAGELEEDTGGVLSDVILPIAAASMVGYAIYDLFDNKPKESIIAPKNPLVVPPKFTQQKEALATTSSLPQ